MTMPFFNGWPIMQRAPTYTVIVLYARGINPYGFHKEGEGMQHTIHRARCSNALRLVLNQEA